jgi:purine-binding chemotaxis protein CheW
MSETDHPDDGDHETDHVRFLQFDLAGATYALEVGRVAGTHEVPPVTRVPNGPDRIEGVASLDGGVVVVLDGRRLLGAPARDETADRPTLVDLDDIGGTVEDVGLVVDRAGGLRPVPVDDIHPVDDLPTPPPADAGDWFRAGVTDDDGSVTYVFDVAALVAAATAER